jgi:PPP family 3-phenylpropionic acid transporter
VARLRLRRPARTPGRAALAYGAYFVAIGVWFPYLPVYERSLGFDLATIGLFASAAAATTLVAGPVWGTIADTLDRTGRALPVAALLAAAAGTLLWLAGSALGAVPGPPDPRGVAVVLLGVVLVAAAMGGVGPQLDARAVASVGGDRAGYGRLRAWGSLSFIVTAAIAGRVLDAAGPGGLFGVLVPAFLATAAVTLILPRSGDRSPIEPSPAGVGSSPRSRGRLPVRAVPFGPGVGELLRIPELRSFLVAMFVCWAALNATNAFVSVDLVALGASPGLVGIAWAVGAGLEVPLMWAFPLLARRFGAERLLVVAPIALAVRAAGCALATSPEVLVAVTAIQGIGFSFAFVGGVAHVARLAPRGLGATAQGVFGSATVGLGAIVGSGTAGLVAGIAGLQAVFALSASASLIAAGLVVRSLRGPRRAGYDDAAPVRLSATEEREWISD